MTEVKIIPILEDNYAYLLCAQNGQTAIIDPGEAQPISEALKAQKLTLDYIINTHHHWDHTDGNQELIDDFGAQLVGPAKESSKISGLDITLSEGDDFAFGGEEVQIIETPGHTLGHICLYFPDSKMVFTGDTLFLMGCGRLFEGTAQQMWQSFEKLVALPDDTKVYCGHEYTEGLGKFCQTIEPENEALKTRMDNVATLRANKKPTVPGTIGLEKETNAFLRAGSAERFAELRSMKDRF